MSIQEKHDTLKSIAETIKFYGAKALTTEQTGAIEALHARMEFRLDQLVTESKEKEADIKLDIYQKVLDIMKQL